MDEDKTRHWLDVDKFERIQDRGHPDLEFKRIIDENKNKKFQKHLEQAQPKGGQ